jgi:hypothetical protein
MATTTFDKDIVLDREAADRLAALFDAPPRKLPDLSEFFKESEEKSRCMLRSLKTYSTKNPGKNSKK